MKRYLIIPALALSLEGCTTAQIEQGKSLARASINVICASYPALDWEFQNIARSRNLSPTIVADEQLAVGALAAICEDPPIDTKTAIASASRVFAKLLAAADAARKAGA